MWIHGDITPSNLLITDDRLSAVIDFGCTAIGDPAGDLAIAWTTFSGTSRATFAKHVDTDDATWARARGWALWKAIKWLPDLPEDHPRNDGTRFGWRYTALGVIEAIITEHLHRGQ